MNEKESVLADAKAFWVRRQRKASWEETQEAKRPQKESRVVSSLVDLPAITRFWIVFTEDSIGRSETTK